MSLQVNISFFRRFCMLGLFLLIKLQQYGLLQFCFLYVKRKVQSFELLILFMVRMGLGIKTFLHQKRNL